MPGTSAHSPQQIVTAFGERGFVCGEPLATTLFLAESLGKPLLVEGPPGVGKTELGKLWAQLHDGELIRLQCYEGLDESKALYEWSYGKQMLYAQLLREKTSDLLGESGGLSDSIARLEGQADAFFSRAFLLPRPILAALTAKRQTVLLIDEIDRADEEFEAFLLEVLSEGQVTLPELGTIRAAHPLRVLLTSNDSRELSDALRRRCLYHYLDYPGRDEELEIVQRRLPGLDAVLRERLVGFVQSIRKGALRKAPGIAETLDWAAALIAVGSTGMTDADLRKTLGVLLKNREDLERVLAELPRHRR